MMKNEKGETIVATYNFTLKNGQHVTCHMMGDDYMYEPPEVIERRIAHMKAVTARILRNAELRRMEEEKQQAT